VTSESNFPPAGSGTPIAGGAKAAYKIVQDPSCEVHVGSAGKEGIEDKLLGSDKSRSVLNSKRRSKSKMILD